MSAYPQRDVRLWRAYGSMSLQSAVGLLRNHEFEYVGLEDHKMDITIVKPTDHFRTRRKRSPSLPWRPVALVPTARFCGEIIFPRTPPEELAPTVRLGLRLSCWAVTFCRLANRAFEE